MIVKDEERFLADCLASARNVVDEMIVVDTGSQDSTVSIAESFGARVVHYPWGDHFAEARNQALAAARGEFVLQLDADERLDAASAHYIREAVEAGDWDIGLLPFIDMNEDGPSARRWQAPRLFRLTPGARYVGRVHEQIALPLAAIRRRAIGATVFHHGYQQSVYSEKDKTERSLRLLDKALQDPEAKDPLLRANFLYHRAQLCTGRELLDRHEAFAGYIQQQWGDMPPAVPWVTGGLAQHCLLLSDDARHQEAASLATELIERHGPSPMLRFVLARAPASQGDLAGAERELGHLFCPNPEIALEHRLYGSDVRLLQCRAHFLMGVICDWQERLAEAIEHYQAAYQEEPDQPLFLGALLCVLVRSGRYRQAQEVLDRSGAPSATDRAPLDCLGLVLALITQSAARLTLWGGKVRQAATSFPAAAGLLQRLSELGARHQFRLEDFPQVEAAVSNRPDPATLRLPVTVRKGTEIGR